MKLYRHPGLRVMTYAEYDALPGTRASDLKRIARSPLAYRYAADHPDDGDSDTLRLGRATHSAVFEPDTFARQYVVWTGDARRGKAWDAFKDEHADKTILTAAQNARAWGIGQAVRRHRVASELLREGVAERTIAWKDSETGEPMKARLDWLGDGHLDDLKTAAQPFPRPFGIACLTYGYHTQMATHADGVEAVTGTLPDVRLIAVEPLPPHDVGVYLVGGDVLDAGRRARREAIVTLQGCRETDTWPGFAPCELDLQFPEWALDAAVALEFDGEPLF